MSSWSAKMPSYASRCPKTGPTGLQLSDKPFVADKSTEMILTFPKSLITIATFSRLYAHSKCRCLCLNECVGSWIKSRSRIVDKERSLALIFIFESSWKRAILTFAIDCNLLFSVNSYWTWVHSTLEIQRRILPDRKTIYWKDKYTEYFRLYDLAHWRNTLENSEKFTNQRAVKSRHSGESES